MKWTSWSVSIRTVTRTHSPSCTSSVVPLQMALMIPAMLLVMLYRVDEYSAPHALTAPGRRHWFAHAG